MNQRIFCVLVVALAAIFSGVAVAQTDTTFTYQGELQENGIPANGTYNIDFELWDADSGGNQIGTTIENNDLPVVDGRFVVELDFGSAAFDNSDRWLEIEVNGGTLSPRMPITRTPYSIQTRGIVVDQDKNVGIGTSTPLWELDVVNSTAGDSAEVGVAADDAGGALAAYSSTFLFPHLADRVSLFSDAFESSGLDLRADGATSDIRFYTGGFAEANERMSIRDNGAVIVEGNLEARDRVMGQTVTARDELTLGGGFNANMTIRIEGFFDETVFNFGDDDGIDEDLLIVNPFSNTWEFKGNVGIGGDFTHPSYGLHVDGTAGKPGGGSWSNSSDRRLKKNINHIDGALDSLLSLRGVTFEYKDPKSINELSGQRIGMIAQEVEKSFPDWVAENHRGHKTVTYRGFEALTVEAFRELRKERDNEIDALRAEKDAQINRLKSEIAELRAVVQKLITKK